jgi:hypothetical protein
VQTLALISSGTITIEEDCWLSIKVLAIAHGTSISTIHPVLHEDLGLKKKSARWVPKLLNDDQKQQHVQVRSEFIAVVHPHPLAMLDSIVTMDEMMVCYHTPQMKKQSQQWIKKGQPVPLKAKVHANRTKHDAARLLQQQGPRHLPYRLKGLHCQHGIHRESPGRLHEPLEEKEDCPSGAGIVFPLGKRPCSHRWYRPGLTHHPQCPGSSPHALFAGPGTSGLLLVSAHEGRAGGRHLGLEHPQEGAGRGHKKHHH